MKQFKTALSKISLHDKDQSKPLIKEDGAAFTGQDTTDFWTTGQEFQFYVPWLWKESPEPRPDKFHPNRQVVRIRRLTDLPGFTEELREDWIQYCVISAVKDLLYNKDHFPTCTERQLKQWHYDQTNAWKHFNVVQSKCNLPEVNLPGYDGVMPVEMTIVIKEMSMSQDGTSSSSCLEWGTLPPPGKCIEKIKNQIRIHLTPECSMHIHIRPETMLYFDLQSFKKMASILWLAEDRLDKLYHPARSNSETPLHRSLRCYSSLALDESPHVTGSVDDHAAVFDYLNLEIADKNKLATIWQTADRHQLRELLRIHPSIGKHDYPAYNFFNLFMASDKQTIEFRKMESTIDAQVIDAWIEVFVLLTDFCMTSSIEIFQRVMENLGKSQNAYSTWNLLGDIGCKKVIVEVLKKKFMQQWLPEEPASRSVSGAATSTTSSCSNSTARPRLRDAIRVGTENIGGKISRGYSYGR